MKSQYYKGSVGAHNRRQSGETQNIPTVVVKEHQYSQLTLDQLTCLMMGDSHMDQMQTLKTRWETFISLNPMESLSGPLQQEQQKSLEDFLHLLVVMSSTAGIEMEDVLNFSSDIHSAFNILARKLMYDIQVEASTAPDPTETTGLTRHLKYLMFGIGWLLLNALCILSRQALSCKDEFVLLIVALFEESLNSCLYDKRKLHTQSNKLPSLQKIFITKKCRRSSSVSSEDSPFSPSFSFPSKMPERKPHHQSPTNRFRRNKSLPVQKMPSSDSDNEHRKERSRRRSRQENSEYQRQERLSFSGAFPVYFFHCANQIVRRRITTCGVYVMSDDTAVLDLSVTLLSLLEGLCTSEVMHLASKNALSQFLAPYLTKFLSDLQHLSFNREDMSSEAVTFTVNLNTLQRLVLRLLLKLCLTNGVNQNKLSSLIKAGTISSLLTLAIEINKKLCVFAPLEKRPLHIAMNNRSGLSDVFEESEPSVEEPAEPTLNSHQQRFSERDLLMLAELLEGILMILSTMLFHCQNDQTIITQAISMLWEFEASDGFIILQETILQLDTLLYVETCNGEMKENAKECISDLAAGLRKMIAAAKHAKLEYLHKYHCLKRNHQHCDYTAYMHHHHNLIGIPYTSVKKVPGSPLSLPSSPTETSATVRKCSLARAVELCLSTLERVHCPWTVARLLSVLDQAGICCCFPEDVFIQQLLKCLPKWTLPLASFTLKVISKLVLEQLGGGNMDAVVTSDLCEECKSKRGMRLKSLQTGHSSKSTKKDISVNHLSEAVASYPQLLISKNAALSTLVAKHLAVLVKHGSRQLKESLYNKVYIPVFEHVNSSVVDDPFKPQSVNKVPEAALQHCYCALPLLLKFNSAEDLFLLQLGLPHAVHLIELEASRAHILKIFEVIVGGAQKQADKRLSHRKRALTNDSGMSTYNTTDQQSSSDETLSTATNEAVKKLFFDIIDNISPWPGISSDDSPGPTSARSRGSPSTGDVDDNIKSFVWISSPAEQYISQSIESAFSSLKVDGPVSPLSLKGEVGNSSYPNSVPYMRRRGSSSSNDGSRWMKESQMALCAAVWRTCGNIISCCPNFAENFIQRLELEKIVGFYKVCLGSFIDSVGVLKSHKQSEGQELEAEGSTREGVSVSLALVEAVMRILLNLKNGAVYEEVLQTTKNCLSKLSVLGQSDVPQQLVSCFMRVALDQGSEEIAFKKPCVLKQHDKDEDVSTSSWEDLFDASDGQSEVSDPLSTEEGYDADSESDLDRIKGDGSANGRDDDLLQECLIHPRVCTTLLEVLSVTPSGSSREGTRTALKRLLALSKVSTVNRMAAVNRALLCDSDVMSVILDKYADVLRGVQGVDSGLRCLLIELIAVLVDRKITALQLRRLLQLCDTSETVLPDLLKTLLSIAKSTKDRPNQFLAFPIFSSTAKSHYKEDNQSTMSTNAIKTSPLQVSLEDTLPWPPLSAKGLSLSIWMRMEELQKRLPNGKSGRVGNNRKFSKGKDVFRKSSGSRSGDQITSRDQVHVISLGTSDHCLEFWAGFRPSCLISRLTSNGAILAEVQCSSIVTTGEWFHLAISYKEQSSSNNRMLGKVTLAINGQIPKPVTLDIGTRSLPRATTKSSLYMGQIRPPESAATNLGTVEVGNLIVFNDSSTMNQELAFHLFTMGPNYFSLSVCEGSGSRELYCRHLLAEHLKSDLDWEFLNGKRGIDLKHFKESLILGYTPNTDHNFNIYKKVYQGNTLARVLPGMHATPREGVFQAPDVSQANTSSQVSVMSCDHIIKAIHEIGGIGAFLYFLAKVVECTSNPRIQADAVELLMTLQSSCYSLAMEFRSMFGPAMVTKILTASKFKVGLELLKVLFDACCSPALIYYCTLTNSYKVHQQSDSILQDEEIFVQLILNWRIWHKGAASVFCLLLDAVQALIKRDHSQRKFNFDKLQSIGLVPKMLTMCKERHDEDLPAVPPEAMEGVIKLIRTMVGLPSEAADPHLMAEISDFLLSTHPAVNTFVCHAPSSFYYNQHKYASTVPRSGRSRATTRESTESVDAHKADNEGDLQGTSTNGDEGNNPFKADDDSPDTDVPTSMTTVEDQVVVETKLEKETSVDGSDFVIFNMSDLPDTATPTTGNISSFGSFGASGKSLSMDLFSAALLDLLSDAIMSQTGDNLNKILRIVIKMDTLVILAHHSSVEIRTSVLKLIHVYFHVAPDEHTEIYLKKKVFHLLANQLHQYPASQELVEACLLVTFGTPVGLDEMVDFNEITSPDEFSQLSTILLLSVLERCIHDTQLCSKTLCRTLHLFEGVPVLVPALLENGFIEAVVNLLAATGSLCSDSTCPEELDLLLENIQHVLASIANKVFYLSKPELYQHFEDMMLLLGGLEERFRNKYGTDSLETEIILEAQSYVFHEVLEYFRTITMATDSTVGKKKVLMILNRTKSYAEQKYEQFKWRQQIGAPPQEGVVTKRRSLSAEAGSLPEPVSQIDRSGLKQMNRSLSMESARTYERQFSSVVDNVLRGQRLKSEPLPGMGKVNEHELTKRFQKLCLMSVSLITKRDPEMLAKMGINENPNSYATLLTKELFFLLSEALSATLEKKLGRSKQFESISWSSKETLRVQLAQLLCHMMSPMQDISLRIYTLQVAHIPKSKELLKSLLSVHSQASKFELFLFDLLVNHRDKLTDDDWSFGLMLVESLKESGFKGYNPTKSSKEILDAAQEDLKESEISEGKSRDAYQHQRLELAEGPVNKMADLTNEVVELAMKTTQVVALDQNTLRAKFLDYVRTQISTTLDVRTAWQDLIQQVTHERAVWYQENCYPPSWQLDPTEGPGRVRKRLQRCHLNIKKKFFLEEFQGNHEDQKLSPLNFIFEDPDNSSSSSELKRRLHMNEKIRRTSFCTQVTPSSEFSGDLLLGENDMYFIYDETSGDLTKLQSGDGTTISWQYDDIKELHTRWYQLRDNAMEIFLTNGRTLLLAFENTEERNTMYHCMRDRDLPNLLEVDDITGITRAWCAGQLTNFEYLMQLNKLGGRSFNDLMQYPVFPFILAEYTTKELDLNSHDIYRDLSKPVAVQFKEMEERYKRTYQCLKEECERGNGQEASMLTLRPYHYGSHYSNSGITLQYLVRLPPFTGMFLQYQDNNFDLPDRTFHCIDTSWKLSAFQSTSDVKELIPEFFFMPEFLINSEGFNFGKKQSGEPVGDVRLPPWAKDNPHIFIEIHKQALESPHVSQHLHAWIDLVFGYKQTGQAAVDAISVYHPATYFGTDIFSITDPVRRRAVETMIKTYGQTPKQLFPTPHPARQDMEFMPTTVSAASSALISQFTSKNTSGRSGNMTGIDPVREPLRHVRGMQWGTYVGSLAAPEPMVKWQQGYNSPPVSLVALPTGAVCALPQNQCLLVMYGKERGINSMPMVNIKWSAILSWGYPDGILRLKSKSKQPPVNLIQTVAHQQVSCCASLSDCRLLFIACKSGVILAYNTKYNPEKTCGLELKGFKVSLYGHTAPITALRVCRPYSILVSSSRDGTCIIWDLNRLCYVRSLSNKTGPDSPVTNIEVSQVSGDIASVADSGPSSSELTLWSVNGRVIGRVTAESTILSLSFSLSPAGISINSVVAGCMDGAIRFWSCLDLSHIRTVVHGERRPIICLTFTQDSNFLFASDTKGLVIAWGKKDFKGKVPRLEAFLPS